MKVLVAGASGAIGRQLVPQLEAAGHEVVGLARTVSPLAAVAVNALDPRALRTAVRDVAPDAVVNMLTAIPARLNPKRTKAEFALTNRLRTEGTRNLLAAARESGVRRIIGQGLAYPYQPGAGLANEDTPLWRRPPAAFVPNLTALQELETMTIRAGGTVLRLGHLYGPGTMFAADGSIADDVRAGRMPIAGAGASVFSFVHVGDVATAVAAALDHETPNALNIVDDDPTPVRVWLPELAEALGAPPPRRVPLAFVRLAAGAWGAAYLGSLRGADNSRARRVLGWQPRRRSWRVELAVDKERVRDAIT